MNVKILRQTQKGRNLEYLTIGWNSLEAVAAIVAVLIAGSIALVGVMASGRITESLNRRTNRRRKFLSA